MQSGRLRRSRCFHRAGTGPCGCHPWHDRIIQNRTGYRNVNLIFIFIRSSNGDGRMRFLPLALVMVFFGVSIGWRAWLQRRRTGSFGVVLWRGGSVEKALGLAAPAMPAGPPAPAALAAPRPG